jgi:transposase-like protein
MVNTREIAVEYRLSHWAEIMRRRVESGLNIKAYCEEEGIHQNVYHYWQRKLREAAVNELLPAAIEPEKTEASGKWLEVKVAEGLVSEKKGSITVEMRGCRIAVDEETDMELLAKIHKALIKC